MRRRTPETAPHCVNCGYLLYGLKENRCPECGASFDPNRAPIEDWESDPQNAEDVRAIRFDRLLGWIGIVLYACGVVMTGIAMSRRRHFFYFQKDPALLQVLPLILWHIQKKEDEPMNRLMFWTGFLSAVWGL